MRNVSRAALRVAGLMAMALFVAHCGDSDVRVTTGVSPEPGTFRGTTGTGEAITIEVGTIESVTLECSSETLVQHFVPPAPVNSDGTFDVEVTDQGKKVHVSGRFGTNNSVAGTINDEDGDCDTRFDATRSTGVPTTTRTTTPTGGLTATPTLTPEPSETPTPTGVTVTPTGETPTADGGTPTLTPTSAASPCPSKIDFVGTSGDGKVLDAGWTGQSHDSQVVSAGKITVDVTRCTNASKPCGTCNFTGPKANVHADNGDINNQRCTGDTRTKCTGDSDCGTAGGTCEFYFGSYLPLSAGGVSTCVGNVLDGAITGTANTETGASASTAKLISRVYSGPTADNPCPKCVGDSTANDGTRGGTCNSGKNSGQTCDINGVSPNSFFGSTSLDCPPPDLGLIAALPIDLANTTGTKTKQISAASPSCRAPGFTTLKCFCDTCNNTAATPCASNADCSGGICGGKRCQGGSNNGTACTNNSECPGGACGVPGLATAPNQCDDATCTANPADTDGSDEGACEGGPFPQFCTPTAGFKSCTKDADCAAFAGNTCGTATPRDCFADNGVIGGTIRATGAADPPVNGVSHPTLAALFCVGPTSSGGVNSVAGLPGPGRLELPGLANEIP